MSVDSEVAEPPGEEGLSVVNEWVVQNTVDKSLLSCKAIPRGSRILFEKAVFVAQRTESVSSWLSTWLSATSAEERAGLISLCQSGSTVRTGLSDSSTVLRDLLQCLHCFGIDLTLTDSDFSPYSEMVSEQERMISGDGSARVSGATPVHLGVGLFAIASQLTHSCAANCVVNVIDRLGMIEVRVCTDVPSGGIPLTRNWLDCVSLLDDSSAITHPTSDSPRCHPLCDPKLLCCKDRCALLVSRFHLVCRCVRCADWDYLRSVKCVHCAGDLLSRPPYSDWHCQSCLGTLDATELSSVFAEERQMAMSVTGIDMLLRLRMRLPLSVRKKLYDLVNQASLVLAKTDCHPHVRHESQQ